MLTREKKFTPTAMTAMLGTRGKKGAQITGVYQNLNVALREIYSSSANARGRVE